MNIPFSDEPTLPLSCTSDVNLLADANILEVVELQLNESLDTTGNVPILNDDMLTAPPPPSCKFAMTFGTIASNECTVGREIESYQGRREKTEKL